MTEITHFMVVAFDYVDGRVVAGEPIKCPGPAAGIEHAQGLWNTFDHGDAIAFSRTTDLEIGKLNARHVLRQFGQGPTDIDSREGALMLSAIVVINLPEKHETKGHHPKWRAFLADTCRASGPMVRQKMLRNANGQSAVVFDLAGNSGVWHLDHRRHHGIEIAFGLDTARNSADYRRLNQSLSGDPLSSACVEYLTRKLRTVMCAFLNSP
jgi:hypothetical protein